MRISVKVKPSSKQTLVEKAGDNSYTVWVKAKPVGGKATEAVIKALAEYFDKRKSGIILIKGQASKLKIFDIVG